MTEQIKSDRVCRRHVWQRGLLGVVLAVVGWNRGALGAQSYKISKKQAGYVLHGKNATQICAQCTYYVLPNDCLIVQGPISPEGWCTYYND
jgi:hypothetical protein